jgi:hypothetical protein
MVNANGENNYNCECCKFQRDGLLCCHVLKVFTHIGVDMIPEKYIMRRWTQQAIVFDPMPTEPVLDDVMPEQSRQKIRFANLSTSFVQIAKVGSESDQAEAIARRHIKEMKVEFAQLNKIRKKKNSSKAKSTSTSVPQPTARNTGHAETSGPNVQQTTAPNV